MYDGEKRLEKQKIFSVALVAQDLRCAALSFKFPDLEPSPNQSHLADL